ncbi:hypothetical protein F4779DRAFT_618334 [Xylariaceae sp. FL0662B]|nr:hypothetical protein F4779DRAFT_618334 [Xylariaceae sp. FL0662B]
MIAWRLGHVFSRLHVVQVANSECLKWEVRNQAGKHVRDVAVKYPINATGSGAQDAFRNEVTWMEKFSTSEHFIQLANLGQDVLRNDFYNQAAGLDPVMIMEVLDKCDLRELIIRINESVELNDTLPPENRKLEFIPSRVLWRIFLCLARCIVGMAYPPPDPQFRVAPILREEVKPTSPPTKVLHGDLDPSNIFIGELGSYSQDPEHSRTPICKSMFNLLTLRHTKSWSFRFRTLRQGPGASQAIATYGWQMIDTADKLEPVIAPYPLPLRSLIARCMADSQEERPELQELLDVIQEGIRQGDEAAAKEKAEAKADPDPIDVEKLPQVESDELVEKFNRDYFREPFMKLDRYDGLWGRS